MEREKQNIIKNFSKFLFKQYLLLYSGLIMEIKKLWITMLHLAKSVNITFGPIQKILKEKVGNPIEKDTFTIHNFEY